jgi:hypothetical protein
MRWGLSALIILAVAAAGCKTEVKDERSAGRIEDDKHINENVQNALKTDPTYKFSDVSVSTFAGIVSLGGFVNTDDQRARAVSIARTTGGVREVSNGISLKPQPMMSAPTSRPGSEQRIYSPQVSPAPTSQNPAPSTSAPVVQPESK